MNDVTEDVLLVDDDHGIRTITLNRPERHNAVGGGLHERLMETLRDTATATDVRVVILRGAGKSFCSGGDVESFATDEAPSPAQRMLGMAGARELIDALLAVKQPIVCAVRGYALGLGATIALFGDVVVAAEDAAIADTHVPVGLVAGDGGAVAWPLLMGFGRAKYYLMTGERISGAEAAEAGLVLKAVPADQVDDEARAIAERLASLPPMAVAGTKATVNLIAQQRASLVLDHGLFLEGATFLSEDHAEAASAFMEKRSGSYRNR